MEVLRVLRSWHGLSCATCFDGASNGHDRQKFDIGGLDFRGTFDTRQGWVLSPNLQIHRSWGRGTSN